MAGLLKWITSGTSRLLDPDRDARIERAGAHIERELARQRKNFSLDEALRGVQLFTEDVPLATRQAFRLLAGRAWRDGELSQGEQKTLQWAAQTLGLSAAVAQELQREVGLRAFQTALARAIDDGVLSDDEVRELERLSASLGCPLGTLMRTYFEAECDGLLRGLFMTAIADGRIGTEEWTRLVNTTGKLGLRRDELLAAIQQPAQRFVEHTLAEAKADQRITAREEELLEWLLANLIARPEFRFYVKGEVAAVKRIEAIESGRLPSVQSTRLGLRAGEIVHAECPAQYRRTKLLKSGSRVDALNGRLTLTDDRLLFDAPELGLEVNHRRVLDIACYSNAFEVSASGKGTGVYIPAHEPGVFARMYRIAVRKTNQTIVAPAEGSTRHIPRDVRQRVWQKYGGRCAECAATDYLEFDHVIPVARGGGNTEANVQLLCRRCNGKKSDMI